MPQPSRAILVAILAAGLTASATGAWAQTAGQTSHWKGSRGGVTNQVDITSLGGLRYKVSMGGGGNGCGMNVEGVGTAGPGGRMSFVSTHPDGVCEMTLTLKSNRMDILEESGCTYWHGARCEFTSTVSRVGK